MKKLIFLLTFTLTITMFSHNGGTAPVTDGLVSYWTFDQRDIIDDTARDVWGKNDGTIVGDPKLVTGRVNSALEFDGFGDYVNLTNLGDFGNQLGSFTFEAWVKTSIKRERWTTLFKVRDAECAMGWGIDFNGWREDPNFRLKLERTFLFDNSLEFGPKFDENINFTKDVIRFYRTNNVELKVGPPVCKHSTAGLRFPISDGEWHHLVWVNGADVDENGREHQESAIYIDGKWKVRGRGSGQPVIRIPFMESVYLGAGNNRGKAERFFNGIIDEVRIYNRPLTEDEVAQNFEIGLSVEASEKLPVVWGALKTAQ
ncbi:LamG domain-containing protein [Candidatus Poribacteria bacterium]|nr:LamG domain-containing protein [Candidatus Poribacteria bacterium]